MTCKHKFVFSRNENYWYRSSRYQLTYVSNDYYFCEHCLHEEIKHKQETIQDDDRHKLPEWAKGITSHGVDTKY